MLHFGCGGFCWLIGVCRCSEWSRPADARVSVAQCDAGLSYLSENNLFCIRVFGNPTDCVVEHSDACVLFRKNYFRRAVSGFDFEPILVLPTQTSQILIVFVREYRIGVEMVTRPNAAFVLFRKNCFWWTDLCLFFSAYRQLVISVISVETGLRVPP